MLLRVYCEFSERNTYLVLLTLKVDGNYILLHIYFLKIMGNLED